MRHRFFAAAVALAAFATTARALPMFARREGVSCSACHVNIPLLNRIGYEYRNNGYRFPDALGKEATPVDFGNFNSAAVKNENSWTRQSGTTDSGAAASSRPLTTLQFLEASLYPATGAFGRWFSSSGEISLSPGSVEIEKGYLRFTYGTGASHLNVRAGVIHPFEGYGASDESVGLSDPLFREAAPFDRATRSLSFFAPMNFNQAAFEVGYTYRGFNVSAAILNGIVISPDASGAEAFIGGESVRPTADPNYNKKDFEIFANQFIGDAALSAHWYHGAATTPFTPDGGATFIPFTNEFDRVALYGTLPLIPTLWVLGGAQWGWDRRVDTTGAILSSRYMSAGWFGEVYVPWSEYVGGVARYDWFDPSRSSGRDLSQAFTIAATFSDQRGGQAILEYRLRDDQTGPSATLKTHEIRARFLYTF